MTYRARLDKRALPQLGRGFPPDALDALVGKMAEVCENPYDPGRTEPTGEGEQVRRVFFAGDQGMATFYIDDTEQIVLITNVSWLGTY